MSIKLNIDKFNSEKNGYECSFYFSENLKQIEKKLGAYTRRDEVDLPEWMFSSKSQHFVAKVGFNRDGEFFSEVLQYPKNINIETLKDFNNFCIKVVAVFLDKGFILGDERQIPQKPKSREGTTYSFCPRCGSNNLYEYCGDCGQKLDWSYTE